MNLSLYETTGTAQVGAITDSNIGLQSVKYSFTVLPEKPKHWIKLARHGRPLEIFHPFCRKSSKQCYAKNGTSHIVQFRGRKGAIWRPKTFGISILVTLGVSKKKH